MKSLLRLTALLLPGFFAAAGAYAATPPTPQFDVLGFIQEATLDTAGAICTPGNDPVTGKLSDRLRGGTMMVNGQKLIIPCNTLLQLPAATMTWGDLFDPVMSKPVSEGIDPNNPGLTTLLGTAPVQPTGQTGLALSDALMPFPSFEVRAQGNVVNGQYIVGLIVPITQQGLNAMSGLISYIDYTTGAFRVGGIANDPACAADIKAATCSGALVQVNDPVGRWGKKHSPDPRFSGDFENSTVSATTGIPVCIPRVAPPAIDALCPLKNRPINGSSFGSDPFLGPQDPLKIFTMPSPSQAAADPTLPDPTKQVPMMVGDQVDIAGTLFKIDPLGPETAVNTYISAHTLGDNLGIFTQPGIPPAYVGVEDLLIGTNGAAVQGINQEASTRLTVVGFTSDPTRSVNIYAQDVNACTGQESLRLLATTDPSTQPIKGRFVHRVLGGTFMPPTRNYVMKSQTQSVDPTTGLPIDLTVANGIVAGQFLLPNFEYIFPENHTIGDPFLPMNFQDLPFLAQGSGPVDGFGTATTSPILSQLDPWPGSVIPTKATCAAGGVAPIISAGTATTVLSGASVTLGGTMTQDPNGGVPTIAWTAPAGITLTNASTLTPSFTAPTVTTSTPFTFQLTVTDAFGASTASVVVTVNPVGDTVNVVTATWAPQTGKRGPFGKLLVTATTNNPTAILALSEIGTDGKVYDWGTGTVTTTTPTLVTFDWTELKGAQQPAFLTISSDKGGSVKLTCGAPDAKGRVTCL
ncbi:MAG: PKD domain-containing protein [Methylobacter sp.]